MMYQQQEKEMKDKPEGAIYYVDGREAAISIFEDYIQLDFSKTLLKKALSHLGGVKRIYYHQINSIQVRDGNRVINGTIEFELPCISNGRSKGDKTENVIHYTYNYQEEIYKIRDFVNNKILELNKPQQQNTTNEPSSLSKLKEAKELLDLGVITQEEFDEIKSKTLSDVL